MDLAHGNKARIEIPHPHTRDPSKRTLAEALPGSKLPPHKRQPMVKKWESQTKEWVMAKKLPRIAPKPRPARKAPVGKT